MTRDIPDAPPGRFAPAAERNKVPILQELARLLPASGLVLEIASGTGQHAVFFAQQLARLEWQPSDMDPAARASIAQWLRHNALPNLRAPVALDVCQLPWPVEHADALVCINMVHISPWSSTLALFRGAHASLPPGATVFLYGPYRQAGAHTAPSNAAFDAQLRAQDARWGVRDLEEVARAADEQGFDLHEIIAMPANNFSLVFGKR
jgi:hypothetical protein